MKHEKSRLIWQEGDSWRLYAYRLSFTGGATLEKCAIDHPGAVVLVPVRPSPSGPEVLMLRQYRLAVEDVILELPAGTRAWDEAWLVCAQRELREETGYRAQTFTPLGDIWPAPGISNEQMRLYLAQGLTLDPLPGDMDEQIELTPMPLSELALMAQDGRLQDAKSVVGILRTAAFFNKL
jgi:ADP-ribose pyrophosphatase